MADVCSALIQGLLRSRSLAREREGPWLLGYIGLLEQVRWRVGHCLRTGVLEMGVSLLAYGWLGATARRAGLPGKLRSGS